MKILEKEISRRGAPSKDSSVLRDCDPGAADRSLSPLQDQVQAQARHSNILETDRETEEEEVSPSPVRVTTSRTKSKPRKTKPHDTGFLSDSSDEFLSDPSPSYNNRRRILVRYPSLQSCCKISFSLDITNADRGVQEDESFVKEDLRQSVIEGCKTRESEDGRKGFQLLLLIAVNNILQIRDFRYGRRSSPSRVCQ